MLSLWRPGLGKARVKMKIVSLADTHGLHNQIEIPDGDVVIFAGDFCATSRLESVKEFSLFLNSLPHKHKIVVAGNHDFPFFHSYQLAKKYIERAKNSTVHHGRLYPSIWPSCCLKKSEERSGNSSLKTLTCSSPTVHRLAFLIGHLTEHHLAVRNC